MFQLSDTGISVVEQRNHVPYMGLCILNGMGTPLLFESMITINIGYLCMFGYAGELNIFN